jgi:hypothetical protein
MGRIMTEMDVRGARCGASRHERGQVIVIFAFILTVLLGMAAFVVDMAWIWSHQLQVQRAADAGALAGVVHLPADESGAIDAAKAEALKNGYPDDVGGVDVNARQDPGFNRRMLVTVSAPVNTFILGIFGFHEVTVTRTARAEYILPVPMGSPQNYYGVGVLRVPQDSTSSTTDATDWRVPSGTAPSGGQWEFTSGNITSAATVNDNNYARENTNGQLQQWSNFGLDGQIDTPAANQTLTITGLQVRLSDAFMTANCANSKISVQLSWNAGTSWTPVTSAVQTPNLTTTSTFDPPVMGSATATTAWGSHTWVPSDFTNANFRARLTLAKGSGSNCSSTTYINLDMLEVRVSFDLATTSTTYVQQSVVGPDGQVLANAPEHQGFWGAVGSQGWPTTRGDAFLSNYTRRTDTPNAQFNPSEYYSYAIEIPNNGGEVWLFDPGFCDTGAGGGLSLGTSETWVSGTGLNANGGPNGNGTDQPISTQFTLFRDSLNTPFDYADDDYVTGSGSTFRRSSWYDPDLGSSGPQGAAVPPGVDCRSEAWHNSWWRLASGLAAGNYRLHATNRIFTGTDAARSTWDLTDNQLNSTGGNYFGIWTNAGGRIYGLGAMEATFYLPVGFKSSFYLAQIESTHAGKWIDIDLWDVGDAGSGVISSLEILAPGSSDYEPVEFYHNSVSGTTIPPGFTCGPTTSSLSSSIQANAGGGTGAFEDSWLRLCLKIPDGYIAQHPSSDTITAESGWWKIRYFIETGPAGSSVGDVTTWKVTVRGNPAHLITPGDDAPSQ